MHLLSRPDPPPILVEKGEVWTREFLAKKAKDGSARPMISRYRHTEVLATLKEMNGGAFCAYCEGYLDVSLLNVDHFVPVSREPGLAYTWNNLFLACNTCNSKKAQHELQINPEAQNPRLHLKFNNTLMVGTTAEGLKVIGDLDLNRLELMERRASLLLSLHKLQLSLGSSSLDDERKSAVESQLRKMCGHGHEYCTFYLWTMRDNLGLVYVDSLEELER